MSVIDWGKMFSSASHSYRLLICLYASTGMCAHDNEEYPNLHNVINVGKLLSVFVSPRQDARSTSLHLRNTFCWGGWEPLVSDQHSRGPGNNCRRLSLNFAIALFRCEIHGCTRRYHTTPSNHSKSDEALSFKHITHC